MVARNVHSRPQVPRGTWGFVLSALLLSLLAACEHKGKDGAEPTMDGAVAPIGLRLEVAGLKPMEAAVLIRPAARDQKVVGPLSSLLGQALQGCKAELSSLEQGRLLALSAWVEEGKVASSFDAKPTETLKRCLYKQLDGKPMASLTPGKRSLDVQLRMAAARQN